MGKATKLFEDTVEKLVDGFFNRLLEDVESTETKHGDEEKKDYSDAQMKEFVTLLNNPSLNLAPLAYSMFPHLDKDTARSFLSKKRRQALNDSGGRYSFNPKEVSMGLNFLKNNNVSV